MMSSSRKCLISKLPFTSKRCSPVIELMTDCTEKKNSQNCGRAMDDPTRNGQQNMRDVTPYLKLVIDKDGRWFQNGAEIINPEIYRYFCQSLEKTDDGRYRIRCDREICRVEVEDAPFVVVRVLPDDPQVLEVE